MAVVWRIPLTLEGVKLGRREGARVGSLNHGRHAQVGLPVQVEHPRTKFVVRLDADDPLEVLLLDAEVSGPWHSAAVFLLPAPSAHSLRRSTGALSSACA